MCRALLYLGEPVLLDNLLFQPDSALVRQSYMPKMLHLLNLAGFGMRAWDPASREPEQPFSYASHALPVFDRNLKGLAEKIAAFRIGADHAQGAARRDASVAGPGRQHDDVPGACRDHHARLAAELHRHLAVVDAEHLVGVAVVVMVGIHTVTPGGRPAMPAEKRLEARRHVAAGQDALIDEQRPTRVVGHAAGWRQQVSGKRAKHGCPG